MSMKRLYWKIVLIEGLSLALILGVTMLVLGLSHQAVEDQRQEGRKAAVEFLRIGLAGDLAREVPLANLERIASRLLKNDVRIVRTGAPGDVPPPNSIRFSQGGVSYSLLIAPPANHLDGRDILSFLAHDKSIGILLALAATLGLLAIPLARIVTGPLGQLRRDMRRFASGDLAHRTRVASGDEVGEVARDFNEMADSIQGLIRVGKEMTAHVSHELRSPLTRIDVARQMLEEQSADGALALLGSMRDDIAGMNELIDRILRLSRLELNESTPEPLCLAEIVGESLRRHQASLRAGGIALHTGLPERLPAAGVREDIACLVDNLIGNALKFTPRGGRIEIVLTGDDDRAALTISNDAEEPAVDPSRLAEPFQRGAVSESIPGSGLGLAIARKIVENHGGGMALSWREGTFSAAVTLPRRGKSAAEPPL